MPTQSNNGTISPVNTTGETVTVGCLLPNGIWMQMFDLVEKRYERPDGTTRVTKEAVERPGRIKLNGSAKFRGSGKEQDHEFSRGAGLTFGVPADFFAAWLKAHADDEYVKNGMIFAHKRDTQGQAKDHKGIVTGFEPLNPKDLPAEFKRQIATA